MIEYSKKFGTLKQFNAANKSISVINIERIENIQLCENEHGLYISIPDGDRDIRIPAPNYESVCQLGRAFLLGRYYQERCISLSVDIPYYAQLPRIDY